MSMRNTSRITTLAKKALHVIIWNPHESNKQGKNFPFFNFPEILPASELSSSWRLVDAEKTLMKCVGCSFSSVPFHFLLCLQSRSWLFGRFVPKIRLCKALRMTSKIFFKFLEWIRLEEEVYTCMSWIHWQSLLRWFVRYSLKKNEIRDWSFHSIHFHFK